MIITSVERSPRRRGRVDVYLDGRRAFDLTSAGVARHGLRAGLQLDATRIAAIEESERRRAALDAAVATLARGPRSQRDLHARVRRRTGDPALADEVLRKLQAAGLVDDAAYADAYVDRRLRQRPGGRRLLVQELRAKGVAAETARAATARLSEDDVAYEAALRRLRSLRVADEREFRDRLGAFLQRRGFSWDVARATVARCWRESPGAARALEFDD